ncbi:hypothetical protein CRE_15679 [Caenorhabditis remanei]|uniref:Uncharacterized protein n=1 Tax=Caenorhabditis remanei TaxID=31234 RepID=E3N854_CAERE|nr:hypothetical protein CRE_15679 [Caenorhabditis remanei]
MPEHRCKYRFNTLLNWKVGQMIRDGCLFKILHADPSTCQHFNGSLDTDISPFMIYSLNKQKRWEVGRMIDQKFMELLQELNENLDLMFFQRVSVHPWIDNWKWFPPHYYTAMNSSKIREQFEISKDGEYNENTFGAVGRYYGTAKKKVKWIPTTIEVVTYHVVQEPRNWRKVYTKDFKKYPWDRHNDTHLRKSQFDPKSLKYDLNEFYEENDKFHHDIMDIPSEILMETPPKFYNFMNYLVEKPRKNFKKVRDNYVIIY